MADEAKRPVVRSKDFRVAFASAFRFRASDNDVGITISAELADEKGESFIQDEFTAMMTPRSAKVLLVSLQSVIDKYEAALGPITLPDGKMEEIVKSFIERGRLGK